MARKRAEYRASLEAKDSANQLKEESQMQRAYDIASSHSPIKSGSIKAPAKGKGAAAPVMKPPVLDVGDESDDGTVVGSPHKPASAPYSITNNSQQTMPWL